MNDELFAMISDIKATLISLECSDKTIISSIAEIKKKFDDQEERLRSVETFIARMSFFREIAKYAIPIIFASFFTGMFIMSDFSDHKEGSPLLKALYDIYKY